METKKNISEKNNELFEKMHNGDETAREELLKLNKNLVGYVLKRIYTPKWYYTVDDCFQVGLLGLLKAIDSFENGGSFFTYAEKCVTYEILAFYRSTRKLERNVSFESSVEIPKAGEGVFEDGDSLESLLEDKSSVNRIQENLETKELINKIKYLSRCVLTPLEQKVFLSTYMNKNFKNRQEIAASLGVSQNYVSLLRKKVKKKIKIFFVKGEVFHGGVSQFKDGASYLLPTKEMYARMLQNNEVIQKNTAKLLKRYAEDDKQAFVDIFIMKKHSDKFLANKLMLAFDDYGVYKDKLFSSVYENYCKFLLGEVSYDEKNQPIGAQESLIGGFKRISREIKINNANFVKQMQQNEEVRAFVKSYLPTMRPCFSRVFALKYFTTPSLTNSEIAERLNLKKSSVETILSAATKEIGTAYQNGEKPEDVAFSQSENKNFIEQMQHDEQVQAFVKSYLPTMPRSLSSAFTLKYLTTPSLTNSEIAKQLNKKESSTIVAIQVAIKEIRTAYQNGERPGEMISSRAKNRNFIEQMRQDEEVQAFVKSYLPTMPTYLAKAFTLKYFTTPSLTNSEIAEQLNITKKTLQTHMYLASKEIRTAYENEKDLK